MTVLQGSVYYMMPNMPSRSDRARKRSSRRSAAASVRRAPRKAKPVAAERFKGLRSLIGRKVVFDTQGPVMYLGTLRAVLSDGYWLEDADIRDRTEGHDTKERYACEARSYGIRANRRRIFVCAGAVISVSALDDVIVEYQENAG